MPKKIKRTAEEKMIRELENRLNDEMAIHDDLSKFADDFVTNEIMGWEDEDGFIVFPSNLFMVSDNGEYVPMPQKIRDMVTQAMEDGVRAGFYMAKLGVNAVENYKEEK